MTGLRLSLQKLFPMQTPVIVRAIAAGGKFIGDLVGGYSVTLGIPGMPPQTFTSKGSSGNTAGLMQQVRLRTSPLPTNSDTVELPGEWAASAAVTVDIDAPVMATISVCGPGNFPGQQATVTTTAWLLPGTGLTGDPKFSNGLLVELPGLLIQNASVKLANNMLGIAAQVTMMCGCKIIDNNGIWISSDFSVTAQLLDKNNVLLAETPLNYVPYTGPSCTPSLFSASVSPPAGAASVRIIASQHSMANTGCAVVAI